MKKLFLILAIVLYTSMCFAQQNSTFSTGTDTVRAAAFKQGKIKFVNGIAMNSGLDVVHNLARSNNYSAFVSAIRSGGLIETFTSRGPITVFAPDNAAFTYLITGQLDTLMKPTHLLELDNFITYHAVRGNFKAKDISKLIHDNNGHAELTTIAGGKLVAHIDANRNIVLVDENGGESIISTFDIPQSNGMLHMITRVLVPKYKAI